LQTGVKLGFRKSFTFLKSIKPLLEKCKSDGDFDKKAALDKASSAAFEELLESAQAT
jgi:hypothetical protein